MKKETSMKVTRSFNALAEHGHDARQFSATEKPALTPAAAGRRVLLRALLAVTVAAATPAALAGSAAGAAAAALQRKALAGQAQKQAQQQPQGKPRDVVIRRSEHPQAAAHIDHAQRQGQPSVLHIDRAGAEQRRRASTGSVHRETRPGPNFDRDEYPPAFTREGGGNANVRFIPRRDNRGAGSSMSHQSRDLKDGEKIRVIVAD